MTLRGRKKKAFRVSGLEKKKEGKKNKRAVDHTTIALASGDPQRDNQSLGTEDVLCVVVMVWCNHDEPLVPMGAGKQGISCATSSQWGKLLGFTRTARNEDPLEIRLSKGSATKKPPIRRKRTSEVMGGG